MGVSEGLLTLAARLVGLSRQRSRPDRRATRNSQADEDDDSQNQPCSDGYSTREIKKNALDIHRDSVNPIGLSRNVTLVSSMVRFSRGAPWLGELQRSRNREPQCTISPTPNLGRNFPAIPTTFDGISLPIRKSAVSGAIEPGRTGEAILGAGHERDGTQPTLGEIPHGRSRQLWPLFA